MGKADLHAHGGAGQRERVVHVVAVADERQHAAFETAQMLAERQEVGERLERMLVIGQGVEDRDPSLRRKLVDDRVIERADDYAIHPTIKVVGDVRDALAHPAPTR